MHFRKKDELVSRFKARVGSAYIALPCGQCHGCRLERSRQWAVRCLHEASQHNENCYITLTYDDEHLPTDGSLRYQDFQRFMKYLRKECGNGIRFYMAGEYGDIYQRPHYHACIFGYNFKDLVYIGKSEAGFPLYKSDFLARLWKHGYSSVGALTFESAAYVARYIMKKQSGIGALDVRTLNYATGEVDIRKPEFNNMSRRPGIGRTWFDKYFKDVFPNDQVIINNKVAKPPKYYDTLLKTNDLDMSEIVKFYRVQDAVKQSEHTTPARLAVREQVSLANSNRYKRKF